MDRRRPESLSDRATLPADWTPEPEQLETLRAMNDQGFFGDTEAGRAVFNRLDFGIATGGDRRFLAVMGFLNSLRN